MRTLLAVLFISLLIPTSHAQLFSKSYSISDCEGAMELSRTGSYTIQFTGTSGKRIECMAYADLNNSFSQNVLWISFRAEYSGILGFRAMTDSSYLQCAVFRGHEEESTCHAIKSGLAPMLVAFKYKNVKVVELGMDSLQMNQGISVNKGDLIYFVFSTDDKSKAFVHFELNHFIDDESYVDEVVYDNRNQEVKNELTVQIIDAKTKKPVVSGIEMQGIKDLAGGYYASTIHIGNNPSGKLKLKCDAVGYFFKDTAVQLTGIQEQVIVIEMILVTPGKQFRLDNIQFIPGTSSITTESFSKLKRLRDFLALNANLKIEIQGHVHSKRKNSVIDQRLSEKRAKRVMRFLIQNGIDRARLDAVGFGNKNPLFVKPRNKREEQANRRVDILIK
jgi:outer membrane protein OmpA-like peptidoglycan-associated protein